MIKTLKGRISLIYLVLVALSALIGMTAVFNLFRLSNSIDGLMTANYKSIKAINNMMENIEKQDYAVLLYLLVDSKQGIHAFMQGQNLFVKSIGLQNNNITEPGEMELVSQLNQVYMEYLQLFSELQEV